MAKIQFFTKKESIRVDLTRFENKRLRCISNVKYHVWLDSFLLDETSHSLYIRDAEFLSPSQTHLELWTTIRSGGPCWCARVVASRFAFPWWTNFWNDAENSIFTRSTRFLERQIWFLVSHPGNPALGPWEFRSPRHLSGVARGRPPPRPHGPPLTIVFK